MKVNTVFLLVSFTVAFFLLGGCSGQFESKVFVKKDATGMGDGTSWADACTTIQAGIDAAKLILETTDCEGVEVWVAKGIYNEVRPDADGALVMYDDVHLHGGWKGTETTPENERDYSGNETIIDGSKSRDGEGEGEAAYHVIRGAHAHLDGFVISGGKAVKEPEGEGEVEDDSEGGGLWTDKPMLVSNCIFRNNEANKRGGAVAAQQSGNTIDTMIIVNCKFTDNQVLDADGKGGAVYLTGPTGSWCGIASCDFDGNSAGSQKTPNNTKGGAIYLTGEAEKQLGSCVFNGNMAGMGSALAWDKGAVSCELSVFNGNTSYAASSDTALAGGTVFLSDTQNSSLSWCTFFSNKVLKTEDNSDHLRSSCGMSISWNGSTVAQIPTIVSTILWDDENCGTAKVPEVTTNNSFPDAHFPLDHCDIKGGMSVPEGCKTLCSDNLNLLDCAGKHHILNCDPQFVDLEPPELDLSLKATSSCIRRGTPDGADIGAYQFSLPTVEGEASPLEFLRWNAPADFSIGCVLADVAMDSAPSTEAAGHLAKILRTAACELNTIVPENKFCWSNLLAEDGTYDFTSADKYAQFAVDNGMRLHGLHLLYSNNTPSNVSGWTGSKDDLKALVADHIETTVSHFGQSVYKWNVLNEVIVDNVDGGGEGEEQGLMDSDVKGNAVSPNPTLLDRLKWAYQSEGASNSSIEFIHDAYEKARDTNPSAQLFYNDYFGEGCFPMNVDKVKRVKRLAKYLLEHRDEYNNRKPLIDGIGIQMHIWDARGYVKERLDEEGETDGEGKVTVYSDSPEEKIYSEALAESVQYLVRELASVGSAEYPLRVEISELDVNMSYVKSPPSGVVLGTTPDHKYGVATFTRDSLQISGTGTAWSQNLVGGTIRCDADPSVNGGPPERYNIIAFQDSTPPGATQYLYIDRPAKFTANDCAYTITIGYAAYAPRYSTTVQAFDGSYITADVLESYQADIYEIILRAALGLDCQPGYPCAAISGLECWGTTDAYNWYDYWFRFGAGSYSWNAPDPSRADYPNPHMPFMFSSDLSQNYLQHKACYERVADALSLFTNKLRATELTDAPPDAIDVCHCDGYSGEWQWK